MSAPFSLEEKAFIARLLEAGANLSSERLAQLSGTKWMITSSSVDILQVAQAVTLFGNDATQHMGAHLRSQRPQSPLSLEFLMLFPDWSVKPLCATIAKHGGPRMQALPEKDKVIIGEVSNILGQGMVKAMADTLGISIILSVPHVSGGVKSELLSTVMDKVGGKRDFVVLTHIEMHSEELSAVSSMVLIFEADFLRRFPASLR